MNLLLMDTSSSFLQLRLKTEQGKILSYTFEQTKGTSNSHLAKSVSFLCDQAGILPKEIGLVVGPAGPGSFTGLRVGMAFIKGFVSALEIPFVFVNVLDALAQPHQAQGKPVLSVIDGKKGRLYASLYQLGKQLSPYWDLNPEGLKKELMKRGLVGLALVGNYALSLQSAFPELKASVPSHPIDTLEGFEALGLAQYKEKGSDPAGQSLFYLRESDAVASLPAKNLLQKFNRLV